MTPGKMAMVTVKLSQILKACTHICCIAAQSTEHCDICCICSKSSARNVSVVQPSDRARASRGLARSSSRAASTSTTSWIRHEKQQWYTHVDAIVYTTEKRNSEAAWNIELKPESLPLPEMHSKKRDMANAMMPLMPKPNMTAAETFGPMLPARPNTALCINAQQIASAAMANIVIGSMTSSLLVVQLARMHKIKATHVEAVPTFDVHMRLSIVNLFPKKASQILDSSNGVE
mmetsp:Transcript_96689/g.191697  ORF Transcript_96689/g.191697 Transcript_96689/m.191697 type:complete len:232 (+) Transcript_96689:74-769(+)